MNIFKTKPKPKRKQFSHESQDILMATPVFCFDFFYVCVQKRITQTNQINDAINFWSELNAFVQKERDSIRILSANQTEERQEQQKFVLLNKRKILAFISSLEKYSEVIQKKNYLRQQNRFIFNFLSCTELQLIGTTYTKVVCLGLKRNLRLKRF